ncbi:MAG: nucleotide exchange factor GrpE [Clostridiales bacterium]|nr:nucleotide exchange factor GrpE [Clostridiales bacterium]
MTKSKHQKQKSREVRKALDMLNKKLMNRDEGAPGDDNTAVEAPEAEKAEAAQAEKAIAGELEKARAQAEEYLDMAQRVQADFDNFRRRNASVRADAYEDGARDMVKLILPVIDNLERALESETADEKLREGVQLTYRQLMDALQKRGVTVIDRRGEKFDPRLENAVMRADASMGEPGTVCQVFQKGYQMGETVLRHAMVQVVGDDA